MFSENAKVAVKAAIDSEFSEACIKHGENYHSMHEGFAVLKEEVDEARDEQFHIVNSIFKTWESIRRDNVENALKEIAEIEKHAEALALAAVQIATVCKKIKASF